ncbi:MAG: hypothetical protein V3U35_01315 [Candidatus Neomarinimicrobiota bacterium]
MWEQFAALVGSLPQPEDALAEAYAREQDIIQKAVSDTIMARLLRSVAVPDDSLRLLLAAHPIPYASPALLSLQEIVVRDSILATAIGDSINNGWSDFDALARRHTRRTWAKETDGELGWVRLALYGASADSLATAALTDPGALVGPVAVDGYYVLARPAGIREPAMPPLGALRQRLRQEWLAIRQPQLMSAWLADQQATTYSTSVDTTLLEQLTLNAFGQMVLPPELMQPPFQPAALGSGIEPVQSDMPTQPPPQGDPAALLEFEALHEPALGSQLPDSTLEELPSASP